MIFFQAQLQRALICLRFRNEDEGDVISDAINSREVGIEVGGRGATMSEKTEASDCSVHSIIAALKCARQRALQTEIALVAS